MSFSSIVKEELSKLENLANKENVKQELIGYLLSSNITISKNKIKFSTENEYNINRLAKLLNNCKILDYKIEVQKLIIIIQILFTGLISVTIITFALIIALVVILSKQK